MAYLTNHGNAHTAADMAQVPAGGEGRQGAPERMIWMIAAGGPVSGAYASSALIRQLWRLRLAPNSPSRPGTTAAGCGASHAVIKVGEEFKVSVGGIGLACQVSGVPDAEPMLLLHALGEQAGKWELVTPRFAERYRVFAVDLRGHRHSDWPGTYSFQLMRDDVIALIEQLGPCEVILVGHSMRGIVAWLVAMTRPDQVARLIIEGAPPPFHRDHPIRERPAGPLGSEV